jgi:ribosomal-protein-alanine N-acetyltransferase
MVELESNPLIMKFTPARVPQTFEQTIQRLEGQIEKQKVLEPFGVWLADSIADGSFIGWFMLRPVENVQSELELGFMIVQKKWNQGFAFEISSALIDHAKSFGTITKLVAKTNLDNLASQRVLQKLGFLLLKSDLLNIYERQL